ncbi:MAG TPA: RNA-binding S4 domain-containing protein [Flavobacteriales bacterium]|jgi:ribosome-associated protein|nr:RNA-binding S4 domain-containing protein [Flavobacteriales bacterium]HQW07128.1 RNA-binding S4 domain-containing protein [Flavobacteriales bacterium]HQW99957.1 RNA-binding S4 domain-containing protein [Flavobacteriales bacterium]HQX99929.1 RNA-binding S4 domain-containing protein [Flavobacteriales bacterium]
MTEKQNMEPIIFEVKGEYVELNQLLKLAGLCNSGGQGKQIVAEGLVRVNGETELRKTCKIRPGQEVEFNDRLIRVVPSTEEE